MSEYETYLEKKWLERHSIWDDSIYLRGTHRRTKDKQRGKHCGGKGIMNHLYFVEMSWYQHGKRAWGLSWRLFLLSLTALVHGLLPFMFLSTTSDGVKKIAHGLDQRDNT